MEEDYDLTGYLSQRVDQEQVQREMEIMPKNPMGFEPQHNLQQASAVQNANNVPAANSQPDYTQLYTLPPSVSPSSSGALNQTQPMHMPAAPPASMPRARTGIPQNGFRHNPFADPPVAATATGAVAGAQLQQPKQAPGCDNAAMSDAESIQFYRFKRLGIMHQQARDRANTQAQQQALDPHSQPSPTKKQQAAARRKEKQAKRAQGQPQVSQSQQPASQPQQPNQKLQRLNQQYDLQAVFDHHRALRAQGLVPPQYPAFAYNQQRHGQAPQEAQPQQQTPRSQPGVQGPTIAQPAGPRVQPKTSPKAQQAGGRDNPIAIGDNDDDVTMAEVAHGATQPQLPLTAANLAGRAQRVPKPPADVVRSKKRAGLDVPQPDQVNERSVSSESVGSQCSRQSSQMNNLVDVTKDGNIQTECAVAIKNTVSETFGDYHLPAAAAAAQQPIDTQQQLVDNQQPALDPQLQPGAPIAQPAGNLHRTVPPQDLSDLVDEVAHQAFLYGAQSAFKKMMFQPSFDYMKTGLFCGLGLILPAGMTQEEALGQIRAKMDYRGFIQNHGRDGVNYVRQIVLPRHTHLLPADFDTSGAGQPALQPNPSIMAQLGVQARAGSLAQSGIQAQVGVQAQLDIKAQSNVETQSNAETETKPKRSRAKKVESWTLEGPTRDTTFNGFTITSFHCSDGTWRVLEGDQLANAKRRTATAEMKLQQNGGKTATPSKRKAKSQSAKNNGQTKKARTTKKAPATLQPSLASNSGPVGLQNAQVQHSFQPRMPRHVPTYPQVELIQPASHYQNLKRASQAAQAGMATTATQPEMNYATPIEMIQPASHDQIPQRPTQAPQVEMPKTITQAQTPQAAPVELPQASEIPQDFSFLPQVELNQNNEATQVDATQPVVAGADPVQSGIPGPQDEQANLAFDQEFASFFQFGGLDDFKLPDAHQVDEVQPVVVGADPILSGIPGLQDEQPNATFDQEVGPLFGYQVPEANGILADTAVDAPEQSSSIDTELSDADLAARVLLLRDADVDMLNDVEDTNPTVAANETTQAPAMVQGRNGNWGVLALPGLPSPDNAPILDNTSSDSSPSNGDSHANGGNTTSPSSVSNNGDQAKDDSTPEDADLWGSGNDSALEDADLWGLGTFEWNDANVDNFAAFLSNANENGDQANGDNTLEQGGFQASVTPTWDDEQFNELPPFM